MIIDQIIQVAIDGKTYNFSTKELKKAILNQSERYIYSLLTLGFAIERVEDNQILWKVTHKNLDPNIWNRYVYESFDECEYSDILSSYHQEVNTKNLWEGKKK